MDLGSVLGGFLEAKTVKSGHQKSIEKHDGQKVMQQKKMRFMRNPPAPLKEIAKQAKTSHWFDWRLEELDS